MSNVSIFEKKWIDLVFEGKNKAYGAYQLRQQSPRTTLIAFFAGLFFIGSVSGLGMLLSSFGNHPPMNPSTPIGDSIIVVHYPEIDKPKQPETPSETSPSSPAAPIENPTLVVAPTPLATPNVPANPTEPTNGLSGGEPGTGPATNPPGTGGTPSVGNIPPTDTVEKTYALDAQPEYPGGIKNFYDYVAKNFDKPEIDDLGAVSVNVSFVIEKDGSMTDIKVLRNPGYGLDKEAIRVLKSLKTKWKPGFKNGQPVRTQYNLPIRIQVN